MLRKRETGAAAALIEPKCAHASGIEFERQAKHVRRTMAATKAMQQ
jgi:hypothetical protein